MKGGELQAGRLEPCTPEAGGREKDGERGGGGEEGPGRSLGWDADGMGTGRRMGCAGFWLEMTAK